MTGAVPKTCHQTLISRVEGKIFKAFDDLIIQGIICEYQPERLSYKGTKRQRIEIRPHARTGWDEFAVEIWMLLFEGRRRITVVPGEGITLDQLKQALEQHLYKHNLHVISKFSDEHATDAVQDVPETSTQNPEDSKLAKEFTNNSSNSVTSVDHVVDQVDIKAHLHALDPDGSKWDFYKVIAESVARVERLEAELAQLKVDTIEFAEQLHRGDDE